jgi:CHAT domain-containing protein/tetratricopeptide (TPR) repeat protein
VRRRLAVVIGLIACTAAPDSRGPPALAQTESLYFRGQIDSARTLWRAELVRAGAHQDSTRVAQVLTWLGLASWKQGDLAEARRLGEQALELKLRRGFAADLVKSYNALGLVAWHQARLADGDSLFAHAIARARAAGDTRSLAAATANLGLIRVEQGRFVAARDDLQVAGRLARDVGEARLEGNALTNLAMLDIRTGDAAAAIPELEQARAAYRRIGLAAQEQNALGQLGTAYDALGEPRLAIAALDSALAQARAQGLRQEEASDLEALARQYRQAGDLHRALDLYAQAKAIDTELELETELGADLREEAEIYAALGDLELSRRHAAEALVRHRKIDAPLEIFADRLYLADLAARAHRDVEADAEIAAARALAVRANVRTVRVDVAMAEALIADGRGDARRVLRVLAGAAPDLARGGYDTEWQAAALRSRAAARLGRLADAAAAGREAVAAVERIRGRFGSGQLRTSFLADRASAYADLVDVLLRQGRGAEAFEMSDAARGRALLDHLAGTGRATPLVDAAVRPLQESEALRRQITGLVSTIDEAERDIASGADPAESASVRLLYDEVARARTKYEAVLVTAAEHSSELDPLLRGGVVDEKQVRENLRRDEALVEYLVVSDRVWLFVVTRDAITWFETPITRENLVSRVRLARDLVGRPYGPGAPTPPVLGALFDALVRPAIQSGALRGVHRLIVVPHDVLTYLPFAALRDEVTGRFLVEDYALLLLPSAAVLPAVRQRPGFAGWLSSGTAFAPLPDDLPATRGEATAVSGAFEQVAVRLGRGATERRFRQALGTGGIVHVASHGRLNAANPMFSAITFASRSAAPDDDGRFEVHELLGLTVSSPLVFLSGCETGLGPVGSTSFARGEDYATLAQAFLFAGARNVVATLWRVEDEGAGAFATLFYGYLGAEDPVMSLARAQRALLSQSRYTAPYYWAPYVVTGEGRMLAVPQSRRQVSVR